MKRRFRMEVALGYDKPGTDGSGEELRNEMQAIEDAVRAVVVARAGRSVSGSVWVNVALGNSADVAP